MKIVQMKKFWMKVNDKKIFSWMVGDLNIGIASMQNDCIMYEYAWQAASKTDFFILMKWKQVFLYMNVTYE